MLKQIAVWTALVVGLVGLSGCMTVASPVLGIIYTEAKWGNMATTATAAPKEGKACATSVLGWIAQGDASVEAAKANGGISEVSVIDHTSKNILGFYGEFCTVVKGK